MRAFIDEATDLERRKIVCQPIPARWSALQAVASIKWLRFPFEAAATINIPRKPGFFCFLVGPPPSSLPAVGYPLYFGRTDDTLRRRFTEYLFEQSDQRARPQARSFLETFQGELVFMCTGFDGDRDEMIEVGREMREALMPAFSDAEIEADARIGQGAWAV